MKLTELRPEHVRQWVRALSGQGLSATTVRNTRAVLNAALQFALRQEWVARNVCEVVKPPKRRRPSLRPPRPEEMDRLIEAAEIVGDDLVSFDVAPGASQLALRGRPVLSVASVVENGKLLVAGDDYKLVAGGALRRVGRRWSAGVGAVTVTYTHGDRLAALWTVATYAGCRPGELRALQWDDVDWTTGMITVQRNVTKVPHQQAVTGAPKSESGRRSFRIAPDAIAALRAHRARQNAEKLALGPDYEDHGLIFCAATGAPFHERTVVRYFKLALARAGLPAAIRFYDLRHGNATAMLLAGVSPKAAAERLGHSSTQLFHDTYAHMLAELDADAAAKLQGVIRGRRKTG